ERLRLGERRQLRLVRRCEGAAHLQVRATEVALASYTLRVRPPIFGGRYRDRATTPGRRATSAAIPMALTPARTGIAAFAMRGGMISSKNGTGSPHSSWRGP